MSDIMLEEEFPHYPVNQVLRWFITWFAKKEMIFNHDFSDISGIVGFLVGVSVVQLGLTCCNCVHKFIFQRGDAKRRMGIVRLLWKYSSWINKLPRIFYEHMAARTLRDGHFFYLNLAVEEVSNYKLLLDHSFFDYVEPLLNHTSSTAKLG